MYSSSTSNILTVPSVKGKIMQSIKKSLLFANLRNELLKSSFSHSSDEVKHVGEGGLA